MKRSPLYAALFFSFPIYAQTQTSTQQLDEITVTATRSPSYYSTFVNRTEKLKHEPLLIKQATSVADALKDEANVSISGGSRSLAQKPNIRGLSDNRVVQVIDGVRQNFDLAHRGSYFTAMPLIHDIQVIKGPSAQWGSGALGGVVAMRTPEASDLLKSGDTVGATIGQGFQSANRLSSTQLSTFGSHQAVDWLVSGFYNQNNDLRIGGGEKLNNTGLKQSGGLAKFSWKINDEQKLSLSHRLTESKQRANSNNSTITELTDADLVQKIGQFHASLGRPDPSNMAGYYAKIYEFYNQIGQEFGSVNYISDQKVRDQSTLLNYTLRPKNNPFINANITLYNNDTKETEQRVASGLRDVTRLKTQGMNVRNHSQFGDRANLSYGIDYYRDRVNTERGKNDSDGLYRADPYAAKSHVFGAYVLGHVKLGSVIVSPSVRFDRYRSKGKAQSYQQTHVSPSIATTWQPFDWLDITAQYNEAFRAPSLQERFASGSHFGVGHGGRASVNTFIANPDLQPETARNKEINARFHWDNAFVADDKLRMNASVFQNDVKNLINLQVFKRDQRAIMPDVSQYQNIANARLRGFELGANYQWHRWFVGAAYGQTRGINKQTRAALENIAADKLTLTAQFEAIPDALTVGGRVNHYWAQKHLPADSTQQFPKYTLFDVFVSYAPKTGALNKVRVDFGVDNVFDRQYLPAFSQTYGSGRNVKLGVNYYF